jgi:predicted O-linked N-acetylglucosamine transferase (SPINDLY family)
VDQIPRRVPTTKRYGHDRIRIGDASSDLSMHAVSLLTVELYELHDRSKFEVHAFCWSPEDGTPFRERVRNSFDKFHAVGHLTDVEIADLIVENEIDVLVDLQGLSGRARPNIIAQGAAPIQIAYLGYPGTTAMPYVDYVVADDFIFPEALRANFSEKPLYLPRVFQVSDSKRMIGAPKKKSDFGISEDTFVFCCFNNNYKFNERLFSVWLDIIRNTGNSILWILEDNEWSKKNLLEFARRNGVSEERLVFAGRIDPRDYLARFQCADIFLDTYPYNAGTTANDLLWAGLPLLTLSGSTYVSRMAGSLSKCMGLDEQICSTIEQYRDRAIEFATKPEKLKALQVHLREHRSKLFDIKSIVSDFEEAVQELMR